MIDLLTVNANGKSLPPGTFLEQYYPLLHSNSSLSGICSDLKPIGSTISALS
jgi:hypothetical protein